MSRNVALFATKHLDWEEITFIMKRQSTLVALAFPTFLLIHESSKSACFSSQCQYLYF